MPSQEDAEISAWRKLTANDLGIVGVLTSFDAELRVEDGIAHVRINMIAGTISNPLSIIRNLVRLAGESGANGLRIEGILANERLAYVLTRRYGAKTEGAIDAITLRTGSSDRL